ncbi:MAG: hypothetical protein LKH68_23205 [Clostridium beijerinckii]|nr:hypothetical protein [Clostridium beijerinckii]
MIFIYFILSLYLECDRYDILTIIKNIIRLNLLKNSKEAENKSNKYDKVITICAWIIGIVILYLILGTCVLSYGNYIGEAVTKKYSSNMICYEFSKEDKLYDKKQGIIVAQEGDIYYIFQLPYRKLVIIKSKSIIVE